MMDRPAGGGAGDLASLVAANVRRHRERARLSLSELAATAGIGKSTLSQIEAGRANPSMETLWAVATALGVPFGEMVSPHVPATRVVRAGGGTPIRSEGVPFLVRLLAGTGRRGPAEIYLIEAEPGAREADPHPPGVVEHVLVTAGRLETGPADAPVVLEVGDLATFPGDVPHIYRALGSGTRAVLVMDYP
ncbi:MAG: helix-turn-helix domain-containing protein [Thermoleophilia bacterium]